MEKILLPILKALILKKSGKVLTLENLIGNAIWNRISDGERRILGKEFYKQVEENNISGIAIDHKNAAGKAYYKIL
jgi:hypothetical protein